jgi:hypothetical protein
MTPRLLPQLFLAVGLALLMVVTGAFTYITIGNHQTKLVLKVQKPTEPTPSPKAFVLPGTVYVAQSGALYSLNAGRFHQLTPEAGWSQPALYPDGSNLLAVKNTGWYSDIYVLNRFGNVMRQVTNNSGPPRNNDTGAKDWAFYPRLSPDQGTLWLTYDQPKGGYDTGFSIWAMPFNGSMRQARLWTLSGDHTGGDVQSIPLPTGGIIYTKYDFGPDQKLVGRLWFTNRAYSYGKPLTDPSEDCRQPSLSPDGTQVAMICTYEKQVSYLTIASWSGNSLGPRKNLVTDQMAAQPAWAPDGSGIAYLALGSKAGLGTFQLWWLAKGAYTPPPPAPIPTPTPGGPHNGPLPSPSPPPPLPVVKPLEMTTGLGLDATSPIAWSS